MIRLHPWALVGLVVLGACDGERRSLQDPVAELDGSVNDEKADAQTQDARAPDAAAVTDGGVALDARAELDAEVGDAVPLDSRPDSAVDGGADASTDAGPCLRPVDCDDLDPATQDLCVEGTCYHVDPCDQDNDGHLLRACGGDDCAPNDPAIPGPVEICSNGLDDDCNLWVDGEDPACFPGNGTCSTALDVSLGGSFSGRTFGAGSDYGAVSCGEDVVFRFHHAAPQIGRFSLTVPDPLTSGNGLNYNLYVGASCPPQGGLWNGCYCAGGAFCGEFPATLEVCRRLGAGDGYAVLQLGAPPTGAGAESTLTVQFNDPPVPACNATTDVSGGGSFATDTTDPRWVNFYGECNPEGTTEALYTLTTTVPKNVLLSTGGRDGQYYLLPDCGTSTTPLPLTMPQFNLSPGSYLLVQELGVLAAGRGGELSVRFPEPELSCAQAPLIAGTASFSDTTVGRDNRLVAKFGDGEGPERVYRLELSARTRIVADLIASYPGAVLYFQSRCGETAATDYLSFQRTHLDRVLSPGVHYVVVDGARATNAGSYVLNVTFLAPP